MGNNLGIKYIVYETRNIVNNKIYIGVHHTTTPYEFDNYLGCGVISTQPYTYQNAKTAFQYAVKKHGPKNFIRKTLAVFDTYQEAFLLERDLVNEEFIAREDTYNMVLGGECGLYESEQKQVFQYDLAGYYIAEYKSFNEAGIAMGKDYTAISYAVRLKAKCNGYYWSTDKVDKLDLSLYRRRLDGVTPIYVYDTSGKFLYSLDSSGKAAKNLKCNTVDIREACNTGLLLHNKFYLSYIKEDRFDVARKKYLESRPVFQYDANTMKFIASFTTQKEAELKFPNSNINKSIRLKQDDGNGYIWLLVQTSEFKRKLNNHKGKPVKKVDLNGNIVKIYKSGAEAVKENGKSVWAALSKQKSYKGYKYIYMINQ